MKFSINLGMWNSVFAVPTQVVDQHLKLAGGVHLKVAAMAIAPCRY